LLTVFVLRSLGIEQVDVVEPDAGRRELALRLGASRCDWPDIAGTAYDGGIECSARDVAFAVLQDKVRAGGRICVLSDGSLGPMTLTPAFHKKELTIVASSDGEEYRAHASWYFEQARRCQHTPALLLDHEISRAQLPETFEKLASGAIAPVKVLVRY
jgi:alcohol dehydrogenase